MSVFRWTAPLFKMAARRWSENDFRDLAQRLRPFVSADGVFVDLGGGTGDLGAGVARHLGARVVIVDSTPQMLARAPAQPLVSVRLATAQALPFPDAYFDAVLCSDAFHHFRDQDAAVREIKRAVRPGGGVLLLEFDGAGRARLLAMVERLVGEPAAFKTAAEMQDYFVSHGIIGTSARESGSSYSFLGCVPLPGAEPPSVKRVR
jgi:demethylmenaquinone methyltransferase/2-methoxy-6-polyprenyl-1,4-benzoquinol methylase